MQGLKVRGYFAYGSNMNPQRVRERGLEVLHAEAARLPGMRLAFDKCSADHPGAGHANLAFARGAAVQGVLYWLAGDADIVRMDHFERTPVNYSREAVLVETAAGLVSAWTYHANPAVLQPGLRPPRQYLDHLLAGKPFLSAGYYRMLVEWPCAEDR